MSGDPMVEEFFGELNDKYYPQILEGLELLDSGELQQGIEVLARPLHTIKGVTGFMSGFEEGSRYTHRVEDYLKKLQSGDLPADDDSVLLASRAVNMVFAVLEQIREDGAVSSQEPGEVLALVEDILTQGGPVAEACTECVESAVVDGVNVLTIRTARLHLVAQRQSLAEALAAADPALPFLLDLGQVATMNSAAWAEVAAWASDHDLTAAGPSPECRAVLCAWGFDAAVPLAENREQYFRSREAKA